MSEAVESISRQFLTASSNVEVMFIYMKHFSSLYGCQLPQKLNLESISEFSSVSKIRLIRINSTKFYLAIQ